MPKTTSLSCSEYSEKSDLSSDLDQHHEALNDQPNTMDTIEIQHFVEKRFQINEERTEIKELANIPKSMSSVRSHCEVKCQSTNHQDSDLVTIKSNNISTASIAQHTSDSLTMFPC
ncbi:unnamed protein product [Rotaria sp. Silwood2]|nr:unnamed protein product [Rotaria sp. Silwood2]CAF2955028.1 unnamed protein product [Rotaria sp. Silwood2]CAF3172129.1 unnamed protein product [Rotaria sp. Silwood2]CAF3326380.1 unnamed protein product [Rotaria sp. Silwood2]CAF4414594.1 unnamed protein product [Rotaria sp. Silwood2]